MIQTDVGGPVRNSRRKYSQKPSSSASTPKNISDGSIHPVGSSAGSARRDSVNRRDSFSQGQFKKPYARPAAGPKKELKNEEAEGGGFLKVISGIWNAIFGAGSKNDKEYRSRSPQMEIRISEDEAEVFATPQEYASTSFQKRKLEESSPGFDFVPSQRHPSVRHSTINSTTDRRRHVHSPFRSHNHRSDFDLHGDHERTVKRSRDEFYMNRVTSQHLAQRYIDDLAPSSPFVQAFQKEQAVQSSFKTLEVKKPITRDAATETEPVLAKPLVDRQPSRAYGFIDDINIDVDEPLPQAPIAHSPWNPPSNVRVPLDDRISPGASPRIDLSLKPVKSTATSPVKFNDDVDSVAAQKNVGLRASNEKPLQPPGTFTFSAPSQNQTAGFPSNLESDTINSSKNCTPVETSHTSYNAKPTGGFSFSAPVTSKAATSTTSSPKESLSFGATTIKPFDTTSSTAASPAPSFSFGGFKASDSTSSNETKEHQKFKGFSFGKLAESEKINSGSLPTADTVPGSSSVSSKSQFSSGSPATSSSIALGPSEGTKNLTDYLTPTTTTSLQNEPQKEKVGFSFGAPVTPQISSESKSTAVPDWAVVPTTSTDDVQKMNSGVSFGDFAQPTAESKLTFGATPSSTVSVPASTNDATPALFGKTSSESMPDASRPSTPNDVKMDSDMMSPAKSHNETSVLGPKNALSEAKPTNLFSFGGTTGQTAPLETKSGFVFNSASSKPSVTSGFTFGSGVSSTPQTPAGFTFGTSAASTTVTGGFSFGSNNNSVNANPLSNTSGGFTFGANNEVTSSNSSQAFQFGASNTTTASAPPTNSSGPFTFGAASGTPAGFSFNSGQPSTIPFGASSSAPPFGAQQMGLANTPVPQPSFSFGAQQATNTVSQQPSNMFGSNPAISFGSNQMGNNTAQIPNQPEASAGMFNIGSGSGKRAIAQPRSRRRR